MTVLPLLEARKVGMIFPGVRALHDVDFTLFPGEVHALIGENGAGKSTLVKVLGGELQGYDGSVVVGGEVRRLDSPRRALAAGIAVIPQELQLVTSLTVAENIYLGREPRLPSGLVDRAAMERLAKAELDAVGTHAILPQMPVAHLEAADRQLVAIARALSLDARCLVMDEPTASLGGDDAARLEGVIRVLAAAGTGVIYVSHKLDEVRRLAERITVLRDGELVATIPAAGATEDELVRLMVGRDIARAEVAPVPTGSRELLRVDGLSVRDDERPGGFRVRDVSFAVRSGEIVGLAGLIGAGRTDLLLALVGALGGRATGRIQLDGHDYQPISPASALDNGLVLLPEERKAQGIFPQMSVAGNVTISALDRVSRWGWIDGAAERREAAGMMRSTDVAAAKAGAPIATLSGGNQQKALLARALFASPTVLLLDEPTRGVDLAAKAELYAELRALAARGLGVVVCSSEMQEVLTQCHRILVFREGRIAASFDRADASEEKILAAATTADGHAAPAQGGGGAGAPRGGKWRQRLARGAPLLGLAAVTVLAIIFSPVRRGMPVFLDIGNLTDILRQVAEKGILAVGMTAVVISGGIDLSVGSLLAFAATLTAWLLMLRHVGLPGTMVTVLVVGALWGVLNGVAIARWRLPAFIATLATMSAARGAARYLSGGAAIPLGFGPGGAPDSVRLLAAPIVPYVPAPALIFGVTVVAMQLFLRRTRSGRYLYAIGDNEVAARLAGIRVGFHKASVYVIAAALAALAGIVHAAQLEQGNPNDGVAYELDAIAAVVIGGTPLSGGSGTVGGTLVGILIIGFINNAMGLNNVDANLQLILKGVIIVGAVWLQRRRSL
ncbi:MAG TPA: ATP-binding cassette domain-containing protein [Gemmatimonadaceae bacterium]|nr:ATP-binding cassette domain-containing protein [Gemmatimonadaceae bacterium]